MDTTYFMDPIANGSIHNWTKSTGTNGAQCLDDLVRSPTNARTNGDGRNISSTTDEDTEDLTFPSGLPYDNAQTLTLFVYGSAGSKCALDVQISNDDGGSWKARQTNVIPASSAAGWYSLDITIWTK